MASFLLDTHVLLWWLTDHPRLGASARKSIADGRNEVFVSAASSWEISIKRRLGKLRAPVDLESRVVAEGFRLLPISFRHAEQAGALPLLHSDSFDRMLVAQAETENLVLITSDQQIMRYDLRIIGT